MTDVRKDKSPEAEPLRFVEYLGEVYRVLLTTDTGSWLIRCMAPAAPEKDIHTRCIAVWQDQKK